LRIPTPPNPVNPTSLVRQEPSHLKLTIRPADTLFMALRIAVAGILAALVACAPSDRREAPVLRGVGYARRTIERLIRDDPQLLGTVTRGGTLENLVAAERPTPEYFPDGQAPAREAAIAEIQFATAPSKPWVVVVEEHAAGGITIRGFGTDLDKPIAEVHVGSRAG